MEKTLVEIRLMILICTLNFVTYYSNHDMLVATMLIIGYIHTVSTIVKVVNFEGFKFSLIS